MEPGSAIARFSGTTEKLEGADARFPVKAAVGGNVLVRVPEGAAVAGVYRHAAIIAPTRETAVLRAAAHNQAGFALCHRSQRIAD